MNEIEIFTNEEFGEIRTVMIDGEPWFVGKDVAEALGYRNSKDAIGAHVSAEDKRIILKSENATLEAKIPNRGLIVVNESGMYALIFGSKLESAKRFKRWVTSEVLPTIRRTGQFPPASIEEQIRLLASGNVKVAERVANVEDKVHKLETDMPLYGCEIDEIQKHVRKRGVEILGGKSSEAYHDGSIRSSVYSDIYGQLKREFGCVSSYKSIKRKYIDKAHSFIDAYETPTALSEQIADANSQMSFV